MRNSSSVLMLTQANEYGINFEMNITFTIYVMSWRYSVLEQPTEWFDLTWGGTENIVSKLLIEWLFATGNMLVLRCPKCQMEMRRMGAEERIIAKWQRQTHRRSASDE